LSPVYKIPYRIKRPSTTDISEEIDQYLAAQIKVLSKNKDFHLKYVNLVSDYAILQDMWLYWENEFKSGAVTDTVYETDVSRLLEAIMWIYYLGDPRNWIDFYPVFAIRGVFDFIKDRYPIPKEELTKKVLREVHPEHPMVPRGQPHPYLTNWVVLNIPQAIFTHLIEDFGQAGTGVSFLQERRDEALKSVSTIREGNVSWPVGFLGDKTEYHAAGIIMQRWFMEINSRLLDC
jgi:hypothetical protein